MDELEPQNGHIASPRRLRQTAAENGLLFFRALLDRAEIHAVRRDILALCADAGWLADGTELEAGIYRPGAGCVEPEPPFMAVYNRVMRLESFHTLAHARPLIQIFDALFGEPTLVHARNIARIIFPNNTKFTTPAHQDFVHVQGTENTWTAWIPLGDCPRELGALALMPGSHRAGVFPARSAYGAGGLGIDTDVLPYAWQTADFRCGDVVLFHSLTVHKALPNLSSDRIRLSVDYRYQGVSQPTTAASFQPHYGQLSWEEVYAGWRSTEHQYYWRQHDPQFVEFTRKYHEAAKGAT